MNNLVLSIQVEVAKRERLLASAEIDGLKKYHFKEIHQLQDQLLRQRAAASRLTMQLQEALQVADQHANCVCRCHLHSMLSSDFILY